MSYISEVFNESLYSRIPNSWRTSLSDAEYKLLGFLLNEYIIHDADNTGGKFYCSTGRVEELVGFNHDKQKRTFKKLIKSGCGVMTKMVGFPTRRWVTINAEKLREFSKESEEASPCKNARTGGAKMHGLGGQKCPPYNKVIRQQKKKDKSSSSRSFGELKSKPKNTPRSKDLSRAEELKEALSDAGEFRRWKPIKEAHHFKQLSNFEDERIDKALNWYFRGIKTKKITARSKPPLFTHPKDFTERRFEWIESEYIKSAPKKHRRGLQELIDKIDALDWNVDVSNSLPGAIETSLLNSSMLYDAIDDLAKRHGDKDLGNGRVRSSAIGAAIEHLREHLPRKPESLVKSWFEFVVRDTANWRDWSGSLKMYVLDTTSPKFLKYLDERSLGLGDTFKQIRKKI